MSLVSDLVLEWCAQQEKEPPIIYLQYLEKACGKVKPSFLSKKFGDRFREITADRDYFAKQHLHSAVEEAFGARRLLNIISELPLEYEFLTDKLQRHAVEEINHHGTFIRIFDEVFSEFNAEAALRHQILECAPCASEAHNDAPKMSTHVLFMEIAQINIGEFRNLIQLKLAKPILEAHADTEEKRQIATQLMNGLISDEGGHVFYTARILEDLIENGNASEIEDLLTDGVQAFDDDAKEAMWPQSYGMLEEASIP